MTLTSSPSSTSSSTSVRPASPRAASARTAATASSAPRATMTPLPAASPSAFTTTEPRARAQASASSTEVNDPAGRRADAGGEHHLLGEGLAPLEPRRRGVGPEDRDARRPERIGDARHQRRLGAHHHQIRPRLAGERHHRLGAFRRHRAVLGQRGGARIPGRADQRGELRALRQLPGERVLPPAASQDQHPHRVRINPPAAEGTRPARPRRTPDRAR